jgi:hypothetical protein
MKSQLIALAAAALLASVSGASLAQDANPPASSTTPPAASASGAGVNAVRAACDTEVMKLCPDIKDADSYRQCVTTNYATLSDGCKSAIQAYQSSGAGQ